MVRDQYDDGGISGGTLERPGLKRLLEDIEDGLVDVVVVYKIDRLSRSLADFAKLGRVDEVPDPEADRCDLDEAAVAVGGLVVASCDASGVLQAVEASLDPVAQGVDVGVDALTHLAVPAGGDDCDAAPVLHVLADRVGVVAAVGEQHPGERSVGLHQRTVAAIIGNLAAGDLDGDGQPRAVRLEMDLGREATS